MLPPVQSTLGARIDHLYYVLLAITGVTFIFTQLAIAFLVFFYSRPRPGVSTVSKRERNAFDWVVVHGPSCRFHPPATIFPMPSESRLWMAASLCVGWPLMMSLLVMGRKSRQQGTAMFLHGNTVRDGLDHHPNVCVLGLAVYQMPVWEEFGHPRSSRPCHAGAQRSAGNSNGE